MTSRRRIKYQKPFIHSASTVRVFSSNDNQVTQDYFEGEETDGELVKRFFYDRLHNPKEAIVNTFRIQSPEEDELEESSSSESEDSSEEDEDEEDSRYPSFFPLQ